MLCTFSYCIVTIRLSIKQRNYMQPPALPDNLASRVRRLYKKTDSFTNDKGEAIAYDRLVIEFSIKGQPYPLSFKLEPKDWAVLSLTDTDTEFQAIKVMNG